MRKNAVSWIYVRVIFFLLISVSFLHSETENDGKFKVLFSPQNGDKEARYSTSSNQVTASLNPQGLDVSIPPNSGHYPGVTLTSTPEDVWNLSTFGHLEVNVSNTGANTIKLTARVDDDGDPKANPWNAEMAILKPNESSVIKIIFGHSYGYKQGHSLRTDAIKKILVFISKPEEASSFRVNEIRAAGEAGEKPSQDPNMIRNKPANGKLWPLDGDISKQCVLSGNTLFSVEEKILKVTYEAGKKGAISLRPLVGYWHMGDFTEVRVKLRNSGNASILPSALIESKGGDTEIVTLKEPILPQSEVEMVIPFIPTQPWTGGELVNNKHIKRIKGTGTEFDSSRVKGVTISAEASPQAQNLQIISIIGFSGVADVPSWVGQCPPVEGEWVKTFEDNFDGDFLDLKKWNIYTENYWDKRTHFTKDNAIVKDGKLILHYEKKTGFHNDNPEEKRIGKTAYACGFADTYGKWTQRYGYFEARMRLPKAPGMWPAFWLMPDRGIASGPQYVRANTAEGGMEFDIMEYLSSYGPNRYNIAMHWDGYKENHKTSGTGCNYVLPDKDGYITSGLLWLPGVAVFYANGKEILRWENPRVSNVPSDIMFDLVSGGWDNDPVDDAQLPADFTIDYVRVWQRKDLASGVDGFKPNDGGPSAPAAPEQKK